MRATKMIAIMRNLLYSLGVILLFTAGTVSCSINDPVIFDDAFVYLSDANGASSSTVDSNSQNYLATYNIHLISPVLPHDVQVYYDLVVGDGLTEDVDFRIITSTGSPVTFARGITSMPVRIEWLAHPLDGTKDNTLRIVLRSCSDPSVTIGKPGPDHIGAEYTITKR